MKLTEKTYDVLTLKLLEAACFDAKCAVYLSKNHLRMVTPTLLYATVPAAVFMLKICLQVPRCPLERIIKASYVALNIHKDSATQKMALELGTECVSVFYAVASLKRHIGDHDYESV